MRKLQRPRALALALLLCAAPAFAQGDETEELEPDEPVAVQVETAEPVTVEVAPRDPAYPPQAPEVSAGDCYGGASMATANRAAGLAQPAAECLAAPVQEALAIALQASEGNPDLQAEFRERTRDVARLAHQRYRIRVWVSISLNVATLGLAQLFGL